MEIHFVSTLTMDDENRLAPAVLQALTALLGASQLAYTVRIETVGGEIFEHQQAPRSPVDASAQDIHAALPAVARLGSVAPFRY